MGSSPSKRRPSFLRSFSSRSSTKKATSDNSSLLTELVQNAGCGDLPTRSERNSSEIPTPSSDTGQTIFRSSVQDGQTDKQIDNLVMLKYSVSCKNEHSHPIDIVVIEDKTEISTVVREKVDPGGGTTFDVLVFKEPVGGKIYVYV